MADHQRPRGSEYLRQAHGDVVVPGAVGPGDVDAIVAVLACHWPAAVVHDLDMSEPILASAAKGKLSNLTSHDVVAGIIQDGAGVPLPHEAFVYRDRASFDAWEREGATPENAGSMVHILVGLNSMTLVGDPSVTALITAILGAPLRP
jgi:hypothetical protein